MNKKSSVNTRVIFSLAIGVMVATLIPIASVFAQEANTTSMDQTTMPGNVTDATGNQTTSNMTGGNMTAGAQGGNQSNSGNPLEKIGEALGGIFGQK